MFMNKNRTTGNQIYQSMDSLNRSPERDALFSIVPVRSRTCVSRIEGKSGFEFNGIVKEWRHRYSDTSFGGKIRMTKATETHLFARKLAHVVRVSLDFHVIIYRREDSRGEGRSGKIYTRNGHDHCSFQAQKFVQDRDLRASKERLTRPIKIANTVFSLSLSLSLSLFHSRKFTDVSSFQNEATARTVKGERN